MNSEERPPIVPQPLRWYESGFEGDVYPGIRRIKAESWHPTELLYQTMDSVFVYIRTPDAPQYFGTVKNAMLYIESVYVDENRRDRHEAEYNETPLSDSLIVNVRDEWEVFI